MRRILTTLIMTTISILAIAQQDAQFSQYMFNGLYINPAYAGYKEQANIHSFYRSQWTGLEGAPQTSSLAGDMAVNNGNVGLGLLLSNDFIGSQSNFSAYANYAYRLKVGSSEFSRLAFGLAAGVVQQGIDGNKLDPNDFDTTLPIGRPTQTFPDARAGLFYSNETFFLGFSADNLLASHFQNKKYETNLLPKINTHYYLSAGFLFDTGTNLKFKPTLLLKDDKQTFTSLDLNAFALINDKIWVGGFYRTAVKLYNKPHLDPNLPKKNGLGIISEFLVNDNMRLGYAFDYSLSKLRNYSYGSHEISIGFALTPRRQEGPKCYF
jgi:type IX secretion system PorP/SprF family membrane protein